MIDRSVYSHALIDTTHQQDFQGLVLQTEQQKIRRIEGHFKGYWRTCFMCWCKSVILECIFLKEELDSESFQKNTSTGKRSYGEEGQLHFQANNSYKQDVIESEYQTEAWWEEFLVKKEIRDTPLGLVFTQIFLNTRHSSREWTCLSTERLKVGFGSVNRNSWRESS